MNKKLLFGILLIAYMIITPSFAESYKYPYSGIRHHSEAVKQITFGICVIGVKSPCNGSSIK